MHYPRILLALAALSLASPVVAEDFQGSTHALKYDDPPIEYSKQTPQDRIAKLQAQIVSGEVKLKWDDEYGWLPALLDELKIPKSSQMLVFSQTSLQRREINPRNPRAIFYNDDVYVGYIPHAPMMEISAVDPKLGGIFYSLDQVPQDKPSFTRNQDCIQCHVSPRSLGIPGHFVRSLRTDGGGEIIAGTDTSEVTHCTPLADRWGGWYVTGQSGAQTHLGNLVGLSAFDRHSGDPSYRGNVPDLREIIDTSKYLTPHSDIVALMVLEHQVHMHNYITRLNYETRTMTETYGHIRYLKNQVNAFLRYLLFTEETPLSGPVSGDPQYVADFTAPGPRDSKGRSLRDLDLQTRTFKYPCSFLIYSEAFDQIPMVMRDHLLQRLYDILTGKDEDPEFSKITANDRQAVLEILRETKPNLPAYWQPLAAKQ
ncbi:MAG: hypothetical protein ABJF10_21985 [Chthoniobacter sp.]|uniref:hypothetical protein n=1 Tax=Chthoniobacter sp. TaxID=2510640 RepID=UPI0032A3432B